MVDDEKIDVWRLIPENVQTQIKTIRVNEKFSVTTLQQIKEQITPTLKKYDDEYTLVFAGSLGRKEASEASDLDPFLLAAEPQVEICNKILHELENIANSLGLDLGSPGLFSDCCSTRDLLSIGGNAETNYLFTRRMLTFIECVGISLKNNLFALTKEQILDKYLKELQPGEDKRPIFLINDLIRYYRTICVDFEYKKTEEGKPWAVKLTKLRHSRKLIYFSTLLPLLESMHIKNEQRIDWLRNQFYLYTPLERIIMLIEKHGDEKDWEILTYYNKFLEFMSDEEWREALDKISFKNRKNEKSYRTMRNNARAFRESFNKFIYKTDHWQMPISKYVLS